MSLASVSLWVMLVAQTGAIDRESYEVYLCPVHRDEQATSPAACPVCQREMVQRILVPSYSCPMHPHIDEEEAGSCPICKMDLVATTRELQWYCENSPEQVSSLPGACPDGSSMAMRSVPMAHGDHNPKHGGILFMAPDGFHHLEGTLDDDGTFRLYLYDDFTRPIDAAPFEARIETRKLSPASGGDFLTASLPPPESYPAEVVVNARLPGAHEDEARFDFVFQGDVDAVRLALPEFRIPETADGIFQEIMDRDKRVKELIRRGNWPDLYIPALEAKELVLALNEKEPERVGFPAKKLVRAAWLLDTYGDLGNRIEVESAYRLFEEAIQELEAAHAR
ncbi:MAG TPA: heavy metal-binding domain-containing protein [Vicinamibacteria bacterium]|nr:heavy metal-binding domain-containing protein [Vicinamibacteria bacterium]